MYDPLKSKAKVFVATTVAFLFGLGLASSLGWTGPTFAAPTVDEEPRVAEEDVRAAVDLSDAFVEIAREVRPGVVRIQVQKSGSAGRGGRGRIPEPFRFFFERPDGQEDESFDPPPQIGGGSGFIVSEDGYIVTNNHVVQDAEQITVHTFDRREHSAELVGRDPTTDVAVIKIDASGLETLSFGDSEGVRVGEWVLAVGNPGFGDGSQLDYTVTAGIVSAMGRPLQIVSRELLREFEDQRIAGFGIDNFIQTDAVINPGNSGGPLVNLQGQVVGVNTAIVSRSGFYQGYGFSIPVNLVRRVMEDLIEHGRVRRAYLGVSITEVSSVDAEAYGLPGVSGALVQDIPGDGPAADAGIQIEDVIWAVDGREVSSPGDLQQMIAQRRPSETVEITVYRNGEPRELEITLGEAPLGPEPQRVTEAPVEAVEKLGIAVEDLTPEVAERLGYSNAQGAVVTRVQPGSPAWERNLPQGWRVQEINGEGVTSASEVRRALSDVESGEIVRFRLSDPEGTNRVVNVRMPG